MDFLVNFAVLMGSCGSASVLMPHCNIISRLCVSQIADVTARVLTELVITYVSTHQTMRGPCCISHTLNFRRRKISTHQCFMHQIYLHDITNLDGGPCCISITLKFHKKKISS